MKTRRTSIATVTAASAVILALILILGTVWTGRGARRDSEKAVRSVSLLYLDELAGRREQVVAENLQEKIGVIGTALELMSGDDLSDMEHLQVYQAKMKRLFKLEKFAFVDADGLIYTSLGTQTNIDEYRFDYRSLSGPEISVLNLESADKKVIIAVPVQMEFMGRELVVCFMEIDMEEMLSGVSMDAQAGGATFCNIYTSEDVALSNTVLGGLAEEDNLLEALSQAVYEPGYSFETVESDFTQGRRGEVCFTYDGITETLSYVPVEGTNWLLTYLIRESVISENIRAISSGILRRSAVQLILTVAVLTALFAFIIIQNRKTTRLRIEKETSEAENRVKQADLEQRLALQEQLLEQQALSGALVAAEQANKAKTAFLSNMSHEIRTPLNAIIGLNSIAMNEPSASDRVKEYLGKIGASAQHLLGIINDILDMSRVESWRMVIKNEEFSFAKSLEQVNTIISGQCRDKGLHFDCRTVGRIDDYYKGDAMKLKQVLINILGNAVKFTPEGGRVSFVIEEGPRYDQKAVLKFTIADTGIGMSEEYLPRLFDAFSQEDSSSTSKYGSTGLGMSITKSIVELMNGHIDVESKKGEGTTFTVTVTLGESARQGGETGEDVLNPHEMSVLVIDDDPIAMEHAQIILDQVGVSCETAASGEEALERVKLRHARRDNFDLILVDWRMPGMDGVETTRQIRAIVGRDTPIIILTAFNWDDIADEAREAGVDTFVPKPLFAGSVMDEFREAFKRKNLALAAKRADLKGRRVLLAEDVAVNAEIMVMVLGMRQIDVDVAENGRIAVEMFAKQPAGYYDAILMDMRMPEMDGLEATRTIRALDRPDARAIPIIALTANAFDEDVQRSMQAGLNAHLSKPVEPEALFKTLESLIEP